MSLQYFIDPAVNKLFSPWGDVKFQIHTYWDYKTTYKVEDWHVVGRENKRFSPTIVTVSLNNINGLSRLRDSIAARVLTPI